MEDRRLLAVVSSSTFGDDLAGGTASITELVSSPVGNGIALREAVAPANSTSGDVGANSVLLPSVSGLLFDDINGDGIQSVGDDPIAEITVYADFDGDGVRDPNEPFDVTLSDGTYSLVDLPIGDTLIRVDSAGGRMMTGDAVPIPRLFVSANQSMLELNVISGAVINSFSLATQATFGAEPSGIAFDGNYLYVYDGFVNDILVFDPDAGSTGSSFVDTIELNVQNTQNYTGLAVLGTTLYALEQNADVIATIDLTTGLPGPVVDVPAANLNPQGQFEYDLWTGLGESADGTKLIVSTTQSQRLEIDPATGVITDIQVGVNANDVSTGLAGASGRVFAGRASAFGIRVFDDAGDFLRNLSVNEFARDLAAGPSKEVGTLLNLQGGQDVIGLVFGLTTSEGTITGTQFVDVNADGVMNPDEQPLAGARVFVDLNNNEWPDANEPQTISAVDGTYTITGIPTGPQKVRAILPNGYSPSDAFSETDRLFAAQIGPVGIDGLRTTLIAEINPSDGTVIRTNVLDVPFSFGMDIAYHNNRLFATDNINDLIHEFTIDAELIDTSPLGESDGEGGFLPVNEHGITAVGDSIITVRGGYDSLQITRFDPDTNAFEFVAAASLQSPTSVAEVPITLPETLRSSVGISGDGSSLELFEFNGSRRVAIDLETGLTEVDLFPGSSVLASDSMGGNSYYVSQGSRIGVRDSSGNEINSYSIGRAVLGLGSGSHRDNAITVQIENGQTMGDVNHAAAGDFASISGSIANSTPSETTQVYLDLDDDGTLDIGEPQTLTDGAGNYTFDDVLPGNHSVRMVPASDQIIEAQTDEVARLFLMSFLNPNSTITELDPLSGQTINSFPAPGPSAPAGMASRDGKLYVARVNRLYEVDADDGATLNTFSIPNGRYAGAAILGSIVYLHDTEGGALRRFDLASSRLLSSFDLSLNTDYFFGDGGLSESADGTSLILSQGSNAFTLDPNTGLIVEDLGSLTPVRALAGAAGQWFEPGLFSSSGDHTLAVRDASGFRNRQLPFRLNGFVDAIAAETIAPANHRVNVYGGEVITELDFLTFPSTGVVSGVQFVDANENGIFDSEEQPFPGVTVFVDTNGNQWPDAAEIQTISGSDGSYVLEGVPYGNVLVGTLPSKGYESTTANNTDDRLFATRQTSDVDSPTNHFLEILEINPQNGDVESSSVTDIPIVVHSTAYDGRQLIVVDNQLRVVYQVTIDGTLIDETPLPESGNPNFVYGPVVVGGTIYLMAEGDDAPTSLYTFDPQSKTFSSPKPITRLLSPISTSGQFSWTLSESADGKSIIAFDINNTVYTIDPVTGRTTQFVDDPDLFSVQTASTSVGGETFVASSNDNGIRVYAADSNSLSDPMWTFQRIIAGSALFQGLGGGTSADLGTFVEVTKGNPSASDDIDFGFRSNLGSISGTLVDDVNGDGIATHLDLPRSGAQVYVDANRNGMFDVGERETVTDESGHYIIDGLAAGDYDIRVEVLVGEKAFANVSQTRLFTTDSSAIGSTIIREHDPITGQELHQFPAPIPNANLVGLALDANGLFYTSDNGLWILDPDTGTTLAQIELPTVVHSGAAAVGGHVFVLARSNNTIHKIDPTTQTLVQSFDINAINTEQGFFDLNGYLGESIDGTHLLAQDAGQLLMIDPDTGVITVSTSSIPNSLGSGSADGETFLSRNGLLDVVDQNQLIIREVPIGYSSDSIGVATVPGNRHYVHAVIDTEVTNADFLIRPAQDPSDIQLSSTSLNENVDTNAADVLFAELSTTDASVIDSHVYELVAGDGTNDADNDRFIIVGNELLLRQGETLDYEALPNLQVRIRSTDAFGGSLTKSMTLVVNDLVETRDFLINNDSSSSSRSRIESIAVEFEGSVTVAADAFTLTNRTTGQAFGYRFDTPAVANGKTIVLLEVQGPTLENGSLVDGNYELVIDGTKVTSMMQFGLDSDRDGTTDVEGFFGRVPEDKFYRLYGDDSGDRSVGLTDFAAFRTSFGANQGDVSFNESLDANDDQTISLIDFAAFRSSFGGNMDFDL